MPKDQVLKDHLEYSTDPFQEAKKIALTDIVIPHHIVHLSVKLKDDMAEGAVVINGHG